jgi:hypothetical protein
MLTRRCSERRFLLRLDSTTNNAFWYCLGWAAQTHGIVLHAAVAMSNHVHVVATDPRGVYPHFLHDFHGLLARVVNAPAAAGSTSGTPTRPSPFYLWTSPRRRTRSPTFSATPWA